MKAIRFGFYMPTSDTNDGTFISALICGRTLELIPYQVIGGTFLELDKTNHLSIALTDRHINKVSEIKSCGGHKACPTPFRNTAYEAVKFLRDHDPKYAASRAGFSGLCDVIAFGEAIEPFIEIINPFNFDLRSRTKSHLKERG